MKKINKFKYITSFFYIYIMLSSQGVLTFAEESSMKVEVSAGDDQTATEENISSKKPITGSFFIKAVSDFNFGSVRIGTKADAQITGLTPDNKPIDASGIEVVDLRGTGGGWRVTTYVESISLSEENRELQGFELHIPTKEVTTKSSSVENKPQANTVTLTGYGNETAKTIFYAENDKGMGKYTNVFQRKTSNNQTVFLKIPKTAKKGIYSGNMIWTLVDGPGA